MGRYKELNLNPRVINKKRVPLIIKVTTIIVMVIMVSTIISVVWLNGRVEKEKSNLKEKQNYISVNKGNFDEYNKISKEINKLEEGIKKIDVIKENAIKTSNIMEKFNTYLPRDIKVISLSIGQGFFQANCESGSYNSVAELLANLQMSDEFSKVSISSIGMQQDKTYKFSVMVNKEEK